MESINIFSSSAKPLFDGVNTASISVVASAMQSESRPDQLPSHISRALILAVDAASPLSSQVPTESSQRQSSVPSLKLSVIELHPLPQHGQSSAVPKSPVSCVFVLVRTALSNL